MEQIRLDNQLPVKKTDHTSKGDQLKWKIGNIWYKSDYMGYEGLSETLVSHLLQKKLSFPTRLSCISQFGLHTAVLSAVAVPVLIF